MKKVLTTVTVMLLSLSMLCGCSSTQTDAPVSFETTAPATEPTAETTPVQTEGHAVLDAEYAVYAQQIERYYTAISEQWDEGTYFENEMSSLAVYYYEGTALDNVGYYCMDLDGDGVQELIIGAIKNAEKDPLVFEVWTVKDGQPVMLVQSGARNRYYLQYAEEDCMWSIANEAENGAANHAVYYLYLSEGKLEVMQGVLFDAVANEDTPWFMAYDLDWDVSNDMSIDEDTANDVMKAGRDIYTTVEYHPYSQYK